MNRSPWIVIALRLSAVLALSLSLSIAGAADADWLYEYSHPFETSSGCPTGQVMEISAVFSAPIPPDTPLPVWPAQNSGLSSWSFAACGDSCTSDTFPCGTPQSTSLRFATDSSGDVVNWVTSVEFGTPSHTISSQRPLPGNGVDADLYVYDPFGPAPVLAGSTTAVGSWTITEISSAVPLAGPWARIGLIVALLGLGAWTLHRLRMRRESASAGC